MWQPAHAADCVNEWSKTLLMAHDFLEWLLETGYKSEAPLVAPRRLNVYYTEEHKV